MSANLRHYKKSVHPVRSPTCCWKGGKPHNITSLPRNYHRYYEDEALLPDDILSRIHHFIDTLLHKSSVTKQEILSLVGLLQHATKIVHSGRTFVSRMYVTAAKLKQMHYFTKLIREFHLDLGWCMSFYRKPT